MALGYKSRFVVRTQSTEYMYEYMVLRTTGCRIPYIEHWMIPRDLIPRDPCAWASQNTSFLKACVVAITKYLSGWPTTMLE